MKSSKSGKHPKGSEPRNERRKEEFSGRAHRLLTGLLLEGIGTVVAIGLIALAEFLVRTCIGERKFFDVIPVQWIFDAAHLLVVLRLTWGILKRFNEE